MKVIKQGRRIGAATWQVTCGRCQSILEYTQDDIYGDQRDGNCVRCPNCREFINHGRGRPVGLDDSGSSACCNK